MANTTGRKYGGRKAGTANKVTADMRASIRAFIDQNWPQEQAEFNRLSAKEKLLFLDKLIAYVVPKPVSVDMRASIQSLSDDQVSAVVDNILNQ